MAEEHAGEAGEISAAEVAEARETGWTPQEQYTGAQPWMDARAWNERGRTIMPILKANNQRLIKEVSELKATVAQMVEAQKNSQETITALQESSLEMAKQAYQRGLNALKDRKSAALKEGDTDQVVEIDEAIATLRGKEPKAPEKKVNGTEVPFSQQPWYKEWVARNPWVDVDLRKSALALGIAQEARQKGLTGPAILEYVDAELAKGAGSAEGSADGGARRALGDKMEGGKGGGGTPSGRTATGKTYADLPAEAKAACDKFAARLVGPGKLHKDVASWRASYVQRYFGAEAS